MEQTAPAMGRSSGAMCTLRTRFGQVASGALAAPRRKRQRRNRAHADLERERKILDEVLAYAASGGVVTMPQSKPAIEATLGKTLALSSVYRMLARQGWRQLAPDTQHPQGAPEAREDGKKNAPARWAKS